MAEQLLNMLMGFSDKWLTGNYLPGDKYLAAVTLVAYILGFLPGLFAAVSIAATAMVARFVGAGDTAMAKRVANQALVLGAMLTVVVLAAGFALGPRLIAVMGLQGDAAQLTARYLMIALPALPAIMIGQVGIAVLRGAGDMVTGLIAMICENAVNIGVAFTLVRGLGPAPRIGWDGLAYAAMCGYITTALIVTVRLLIGRYGLRIDWRLMRPDFSLIRRLLRIGIPGGADVLSIVACQFWFLSIVNRLGNVSAGAHGVAITIESLAYLPGSAFGVASMTLVGQCLGARDDRRAVQSVRLAMFSCCGLMTAIACCYYFAAGSLAGWFVGPEQPEIGALSATLVRIVAFGQPPLAVLMVMNGALRGAGDTRLTLAATFIGFLGVRMPLAYWLAWDAVNIHVGSLDLHLQCLNLGVRGAWYAMLADMTVRALLVFWRFSRGQWKRIEV